MTKFERQTFLECRIFLYDHKSKKCIVEAQLSNFCEILIPFCLLSAGVFDEFEHILAKPKQKAEANNTEFW